MITFLQQHQFWAAVAAYWLYSAIVSGMPAPVPNGNQGYLWLYNVLHTIAGNLTTAFGSKIPGIAMKTGAMILLCVLLFTIPACNRYVVHPGSINTFDSVTADTLTSVKATIDGARPQLASGALPASLKTPLNDLVTAYNTASTAYMTWRTAVTSNQDASGQLTQVQAALAAVTKALATYTQAGGK